MRSFSLQLLLALVVACLSPAAQAYFDTGANTDAMPFMDGMVSVNRNDTIIYYGGENATSPYTNQMYALSNIISGSPTFSQVPQTSPGPYILYGQAVLSSTGQTAGNAAGAAMPQTRMMFSASYVNKKLYVYGGVTTDNLGYFNDFWSLDLTTTPYTWTNLTTTGLPIRYGHTATVLR